MTANSILFAGGATGTEGRLDRVWSCLSRVLGARCGLTYPGYGVATGSEVPATDADAETLRLPMHGWTHKIRVKDQLDGVLTLADLIVRLSWTGQRHLG